MTGLHPALQATWDRLGYAALTPVQQQALPPALAGRDLVVRASTGSGKTAVFGLTLLNRLKLGFFGVQALVLSPTRELAQQSAVEIRRLGGGLDHLKVVVLAGGVPLRGQTATLDHGAHVVVGTPGRLLDLLTRRALDLTGLRTLVFDEADRLLSLGFRDEVEAVARACPAERQTLLFSATYPDGIDALAAQVLRRPERVTVDDAADRPAIAQRAFRVAEGGKDAALLSLLSEAGPLRTLVFCNTKVRVRQVADALRGAGAVVAELSGDREQRDRDEALALFDGGCVSVVVATDVASRGLDVEGLDLVVNDGPSPDPEVHVHRIGRTGRAGRSGRAWTLITPADAGLWARLQAAGAAPPGDPETVPAAGPVRLAPPPRAMLRLREGRRDKLRPGDVLGALTAAAGFPAALIGTIRVTDWGTWLAVDRDRAGDVLAALAVTPVKGRLCRAVRVN